MTDNTRQKRTRKGCEPGKTRILEPGEAPGVAGRPNEGLAREPGAPRIEGQAPAQYRDKTGRRNPSAWEPGKAPSNVKPHLNREMQALCQTFSMEIGFSTLFNIIVDPEARRSEKIKAFELVAAYAFGRPKVQVDVDVGTKSNEWNSALEALDARNAQLGASAPFAVPVVSLATAASFIAAADVIEAPFRSEDEE